MTVAVRTASRRNITFRNALWRQSERPAVHSDRPLLHRAASSRYDRRVSNVNVTGAATAYLAVERRAGVVMNGSRPLHRFVGMRVAALVSAAILAGCSDASVTSSTPSVVVPIPGPTSPSLPVPPTSAQSWRGDLTSVLTAVSGPENCFTREQLRLGVPRTVAWALQVLRTGTTVSFSYSDDYPETGMLNGNDFSARSVTFPISFPSCPDGPVLSGTAYTSVTGRFSDDGKHLTAHEAWTYEFTSGQVIMLFDWSADSPDGWR